MNQTPKQQGPEVSIEHVAGALWDAEAFAEEHGIRASNFPRGGILSHRFGHDEVSDFNLSSFDQSVEVHFIQTKQAGLWAGFAKTIQGVQWRHLWPLWHPLGQFTLQRAQETGRVLFGYGEGLTGLSVLSVDARFTVQREMRQSVDLYPAQSYGQGLNIGSAVALDLALPGASEVWPSTEGVSRIVQVTHMPRESTQTS